jgi:hypothetical protein
MAFKSVCLALGQVTMHNPRGHHSALPERLRQLSMKDCGGSVGIGAAATPTIDALSLSDVKMNPIVTAFANVSDLSIHPDRINIVTPFTARRSRWLILEDSAGH